MDLPTRRRRIALLLLAMQIEHRHKRLMTIGAAYSLVEAQRLDRIAALRPLPPPGPDLFNLNNFSDSDCVSYFR